MCAQLFKTSQRTRPKSAIRFVFASWQMDHELLGALPSAKQIRLLPANYHYKFDSEITL